MAKKKEEKKKESLSAVVRFNKEHVLTIDYDPSCDEIIVSKQNADGKNIKASAKLK